ncbi:MAG: GIN domain-containing protein [Sandaracinaceae bacterium]
MRTIVHGAMTAASTLLLLTTLTACSQLLGSGELAMEERPIVNRQGLEVPFDGILLRDEIFVRVTIDPAVQTPSMTVFADDNAIDRVFTVVDEQAGVRSLVIRERPRFRNVAPTIVDITTSDMEYISATFDGRAEVTGIDRDEFRAAADTRSRLVLSGTCASSLLIAIDSTTTLDAAGLSCPVGDFTAMRGALVIGTATDTAILAGSGRGRIEVLGSPTTCDRSGLVENRTEVTGCPSD